MFYLKKTPGRTCLIDNKEFLFFSGYSYLGMNYVPEFIELVKKGIDEYGILFPSSRVSNTRLHLFEQFENNLSDLTTFESTVSFSSGYLAGQTIADILASHKNIFVAPDTHPAIRIKHVQDEASQGFIQWSNEVLSLINISQEEEFVLVANSINIMQGIVYNFSFLEKINSSKKVTFLIDDSHGIGILGNNGEGIVSHLPKRENLEYILSYSLSKAFNIGGGAVSCSKYIADLLREHPNYTGSTSIDPCLIFAFINSQHLYALQREKLKQNISLLKQSNQNLFHENDFELPIFISKKYFADFFLKNEIIISSFNYPSPQSKLVNRAIVSALHTPADIEKLANTNYQN